MILLFLIIQSGTLEQPNVAANEAAYGGIVTRAHTNVVLIAEDDNIALLRGGISVLSITVIIRFTKMVRRWAAILRALIMTCFLPPRASALPPSFRQV